MASEIRLIDAYKLEDLLRSNSGRYHQKDDIIAAIAGQPTVDAAPVIHGRWENIKHFAGADCFGYCSNCKTPQKAQNATALKGLHRYCRWCGAKMDGGNDNA